jgi:hypothetical protein
MNWKAVLHLIRVDMKSGRLLRGQRLIKYNVARNRFFSYLTYGVAATIGAVVGILVGLLYNSESANIGFQEMFVQGFANFQLSLPTLVVVFTLIFTMIQQLQRSGAHFANQAPYWLPITWQEHTLASILADMLGIPLMAILIILPAVLVVAGFTGQLPSAFSAVLAMFAAAFMAGATTEVFRILQTRFVGAVYKSTGRAAVWVRFVGSILFFIVFYVGYFYITSGGGALTFIQTVASVQSATWFVPFVWLGMTLFSIMNGFIAQGIAFLGLSVLFMIGLFYLCVSLNTRYGLYEPPAITISRSGAYAPKTGFLGKLGFTSVEAAIIRKDLKAFTRRRELISAFIIPIVFVVLPIMTSFSGGSANAQSGFPAQFGFALTSLMPAALMAMSLGNFMTGEEGQNMWRIYYSPISAKNFVKSKYAFMLFFSLIILPITTTVGYLIYHPSINATVTMALEAVFVAFAAGALSLANGIKGADFNEVPRPRMIRAEWSLINMLCCFAVALAVLAPLLPYVISMFAAGLITPFIGLYESLAISGVIAAVLTVIFNKLAIGNAQELLSKAEV